MSERVVFDQPGWTTEQQDSLRDSRNRLNLCHCGSTNNPYAVVLALLELAENQASSPFYSEIVGPDGASAMWVEFGAKVLDAAALLEHRCDIGSAWMTDKGREFLRHGCDIGSAWMTDKGREFLRFLREFGTDYDEWPQWATAEVYRGQGRGR